MLKFYSYESFLFELSQDFGRDFLPRFDLDGSKFPCVELNEVLGNVVLGQLGLGILGLGLLGHERLSVLIWFHLFLWLE